MGCTLSKAVGSLVNKSSESTSDGGGGGAGSMTEPPPPPPPDPRNPLTARQIFSITKSWKAIARAMEQTGVEMFVRLFHEKPYLLDTFEKFQQFKQNQDAQRENMELAQHASMVMATLDDAINSLDNMDYLLDILHNAGSIHYKIKGFKKEFFWEIEKPMLAAISLTLGDRYTDNIENIYKITVKFLLETIVEGYDMAAAKAAS